MGVQKKKEGKIKEESCPLLGKREEALLSTFLTFPCQKGGGKLTCVRGKRGQQTPFTVYAGLRGGKKEYGLGKGKGKRKLINYLALAEDND